MRSISQQIIPRERCGTHSGCEATNVCLCARTLLRCTFGLCNPINHHLKLLSRHFLNNYSMQTLKFASDRVIFRLPNRVLKWICECEAIKHGWKLPGLAWCIQKFCAIAE